MNQQFKATNLADLTTIAQALLPIIKERKKVAFIGEIGAGKTTFIKVLCKELGVADTTSSPTFSLINEYQSPGAKIYHADLYRLKNEDEVFSIGLLELFEAENDYCFIEWPAVAEGYFPDSTIWIKISISEEEVRLFEVEY